MANAKYSWNVFINIPFDEEYEPLKNALIFTILDCGFIPRCALEEDNSGNVRFEKIQTLIAESKFAVHDVSRTELDATNNLPRFNMPLELGVFIGAKLFGVRRHADKNCLIIDTERYRYQMFISDISGNDIRAHENDPAMLIRRVRDWLNDASGGRPMPGGRAIGRRYQCFLDDLPTMCEQIPIDVDELTYVDYCQFVEEWLRENTNKNV